jgi:Cobalamin biosynthesis protein CbiK, Co2+ chelatase
MKKGILVVSFGTSHYDTFQNCIEAVEHSIQQTYPEITCYRAFTSEIIMRILKTRDGMDIYNVEEALQRMYMDGITHVYIQPTHIIDGIENNKVKRIMEQYQDKFEVLKIGAPLLLEDHDYEQVVQAVWGELKETVEDNLLIFMGHGSDHEANLSYEKLEEEFHKQGYSNVFIATVEAKPDLDSVIERIKKLNQNKIIVTPFMLVAGDHAKNDMASEEEDSFYSLLKNEGYEVCCIVKGLGEYESIRTIFVEHLKEIL